MLSNTGNDKPGSVSGDYFLDNVANYLCIAFVKVAYWLVED